MITHQPLARRNLMDALLPFIGYMLVYLASDAEGACTNLPDVWLQGEWFSHYDNGFSWVAEYSTEQYLLKIPNIPNAVTAGYTCRESIQASNSSRILLVNNARYYCIKVTTPQNALALLVQFTRAPQNVQSASACMGNFGSADESWQVRYPLDLNYVACPFGTPGTKYQTAVWIKGSWACEKDLASTIEIVDGTSMVVNSCVHGNGYEQPLRGATLHCKGHVSGAEVGGTDNALLISYVSGPETLFYCAKYRMNGDVVYFSINTKDQRKPLCESTATANTTDKGYVTFKLSRWAPDIIAPDKATTATLGACSFPPRWRSIRWFIGYRTRLGGADAHIYMFQDTTLRQVSTVNPWAADWIVTCSQARYLPPNYFYLVNGFECMQLSEIREDLLLYRHVIIGSPSPNIQHCMNELIGSSYTTILVPYQNYTANKIAEGSSSCPFPVGHYQAVFTGQNLTRMCENNNKSTITIGNTDLRIRTCDKRQAYETPYYVDLNCVSSWRKEDIRTTHGGDGDYLLLSYFDHERVRTHYYVARYRIQGGEHIDMSLHAIGNGQQINFESLATPYSTGPSYSAFNLIRLRTLECGCLFGECVVENNERACKCYQGYKGVNCETSLPSGTCRRENACENAGTCVDVPTDIGRSFYYCRCTEGYTGINCELKDPCYPNPCKNRGQCSPTGPTFTCSCHSSYLGPDCEQQLATVVLNDKQRYNSTIIIVVAVVGVALLLVVVITLVLRQRRVKRKEGDIPVNPDSDMPAQNPRMQAWYADYKETYKAQMAASEEKTLDDY